MCAEFFICSGHDKNIIAFKIVQPLKCIFFNMSCLFSNMLCAFCKNTFVKRLSVENVILNMFPEV